MIRIERLSIRLPAGYEGRAEGIAQLVGKSLAAIETTRGLNAARIVPRVVRADTDVGDAALAARIAAAIAKELGHPP
jgi:hypothetical protein